MRYFFLALLLISSSCFADNVYRNKAFNYRVTYSDQWKIYEGSSNKIFILLCHSTRCDPNSQFIVSTNYDPSMKNTSNEFFMQHLPPKTVRRLLDNMVQTLGKSLSVSHIRRTKIGKHVGYQATVKIELFNGKKKTLYYGLTFHHGIFYNLQFFATDAAYDQDLGAALKLFENFEIENATKSKHD